MLRIKRKPLIHVCFLVQSILLKIVPKPRLQPSPQASLHAPMISAYYPSDYIVRQSFDSTDYDTIVLSMRSGHTPGAAFKVKHAEVTSGSYGLRLILKPFTPVEHWDGVPVYELPEPADIVEALLRDACRKLHTLGPYGQLDYRVIYAAWKAGRNYSQKGLMAMAARYLG